MYWKEMQRHKEPLSFAESPYDGTKHYTSPVLAAQRPFLASSISAELLNDQWVSPQFPNRNQSSINPEDRKRKKRGQRAACKRTKTQKNKKQIVQIKENNMFPQLDFPSSTDGASKNCNQKSIDDPLPHRKSRRKVTLQPLSNDVTGNNEHKTLDINDNKNQFLFSLGSPKPSTVSGEILVHETPENQMFERRMLDRRLRAINCKR